MKINYREEKEMVEEFRYIDGDDALADSWLAEVVGAGSRTDVVWGGGGVKAPRWDCNAYNLDA